MIRFQSARLTIRDQVWDDLDDYTRLVTDDKAMKYMGSIRCGSLNQARESLEFSIREAQSKSRTGFFFAILETDSERYVGDVGFTVKSVTNTGGIGHLGFFLLPEFWQKGNPLIELFSSHSNRPHYIRSNRDVLLRTLHPNEFFKSVE